MKTFRIISPGGFTTVQDLGRPGFARYGVPLSGCLDPFSARVANLLVGNREAQALLELTLTGPSIEFEARMEVALTGAVMPATLNQVPVEPWRTFSVQPGDRLVIGQVSQGCRGYLAFGGGIDVPRVMGSLSTCAVAALGGFKGRALKAGDQVAVHTAESPPLAPRQLPADLIPSYPTQIELRVVPGPQDDYFDMARTPLFSAPYMVTTKADRMGYRLKGEKIEIQEGRPRSIVSEPAAPGSIQIPPDGQPIVLLLEQTVGGYAKIATVISPDLPRLAQTTPGDLVLFDKIDLDLAHALYREARQKLARIREILV